MTVAAVVLTLRPPLHMSLLVAGKVTHVYTVIHLRKFDKLSSRESLSANLLSNGQKVCRRYPPASRAFTL